MSILDTTPDAAQFTALATERRTAAGRRAARRWLALVPLADALVLTVAVGVERLGGHAIGADVSIVWLLWFPAVVVGLLTVGGLYRERLRLQLLDDFRTIAGATAIGSMATIALPVLAFADTSGLAAQGVRLWLFATVYLTASRAGIISAVAASRRQGALVPTLVVGAGEVGRSIVKRLAEHRELGLAPIGFVDDDPLPSEEETAPVLGGNSDLVDVIDSYGIQHVVFTFSTAPHEVMLQMVDDCTRRGAQVTMVPRLFERIPRDTSVAYLGGIPLLSIHPNSPTSWRFRVKYAIDRIVAAIAVAVLSPVLLFIALGVLISVGRPVFFRQRRVGCDGQIFEMLKFRSMREGTAKASAATGASSLDLAPGGVEGEDRRTRFGAFIRLTSLDELPQLFNVLRGEMSLIGPRPERPEFADLFSEHIEGYDERHRVRSGITGWAQINGLRGKTSLRDRVEWDNWYIEHWSPWLDLKIALKTVTAVARAGSAVE